MSLFNHIIGRLLAAVTVCCLLWSCGDSDSFTVEGTVDGDATINLRFIYYVNGDLVKSVTAAREGKFEYQGTAPSPTVLEILDNDYRLLGRLYVSNGDRIECRLTRNQPNAIKVSGNDVSERWASFLNTNAETLGTTAQSNRLIEDYVARNPSDIVSTLLMITSYDSSLDALRADSIMSTIDSDVRQGTLVDGFNTLLQRLVSSSDSIAPITAINMRDSLVEFDVAHRPWSLIVVSDAASGRSDSIVPSLKRLQRKPLRPMIQIADIGLDPDTAAWHKSVRGDSATWSQLWVAGSIASPGINILGVPRVPYFIVADSAGNQVLRTTSIKLAEAFLDKRLNLKN